MLIPIPLFLAKISAIFFQLFPNPLLTLDQLRLLKYDNIKSENGITNFDIGCPSKLYFEDSVLKYSFNYTEGGQFSIKKNEKKWFYMIANFIYIVVALILLFVIYIMIKAIIRGVEAKNRNKSKK